MLKTAEIMASDILRKNDLVEKPTSNFKLSGDENPPAPESPREFEQEWLKTSERFGALTDPAHLTALAREGLSQLGRGVICLAFRHGQPCSFYLPHSQLQFVLDSSTEQQKLLKYLRTYQANNGELLILVTFDDLDRQLTSSYRLFYLSVGGE